jgi:inorganic triphosphatase YgiF
MGHKVSTETHNEVELKLLALDDALLDELWIRDSIWDWQVIGRGHERQRNVYYDTADGELKARGASLCWRSRLGEATGELRLKTRRDRKDRIFQRRDLTTLVADPPETLGTLAPPLLVAARRLAGAKLQPILVLETDRRRLEIARGTSRVELALDCVTLPGVDLAEHRIEAALLHGDRGDLLGLQAALLSTGRTRPAGPGQRGRAPRYLASHHPRGQPVSRDPFRARLPA